MRHVLLVVCIMVITVRNANGQTFIGISCDLGNHISVPTDPELFKRPASISGHIFVRSLERINQNWKLEYGIGAGIMGTVFRANVPDTLTNYYNDMFDPFAFYETFYASF